MRPQLVFYTGPSPQPLSALGPEAAGEAATLAEKRVTGLRLHSGASHEGLVTAVMGVQGGTWGPGRAPCSKSITCRCCLGPQPAQGCLLPLCQRARGQDQPSSPRPLGVPGLRPETILRATYCSSQANRGPRPALLSSWPGQVLGWTCSRVKGETSSAGTPHSASRVVTARSL